MIILYAIPAFMLLIVIEAIADKATGSKYYRFNDAVGSLATGMLNRTMNFFTLYLNWAAYSLLFGYFSYFSLESTLLVWVAAFIVYDFFYYWSHRLAHVYSIFWNAHAVHHQSEEFNLTTALRQPFSGFVKGSIVFLPMVFMGFDPFVVATVGSLNLIYQFWVHTRFIPKLGVFEWVFVTPSNHRVHHGMNDQYIDKNFGGVFILWDRIFKTFQDELESEPVIFGVRKQLNSFNPFYANFQIYWLMLNDIWVGRSLKTTFEVLVSRTGVRPEEVSVKAPQPRLNLETYKPFDPRVSLSVQLVVVNQLLFSLGYTVWFLLTIPEQPFVNALVHFLPLGLSLLSIGFLLEKRLVGWIVEVSRLIFIGFAIVAIDTHWDEQLFAVYGVFSLVFAGIAFAFSQKKPIVETSSV